MPDLPSGTVTFLFTDIEGSTRRWEEHPAAMRAAVERHFALLRDAIGAHGGHVFRTQGDGLCAAFATAPQALAAALAAQLALHTEHWPGGDAIRVRMALHTGAAEVQDGDYVGACLNRMGRLLGIGHGGQTLLSRTTYDLVREAVPATAALRDLGEQRLRDLAAPEQVFQLLHPQLPSEFPPLKSLDAPRHNLPAQLTSFVARERELVTVQRLLAEERLVTLTGAGGVGKTRLALRLAADRLDGFADGVWLVDLAPLADPMLVPQAVASALHVREAPGRPLAELLAEVLRPKRLLLVLDNCEHLVAACAALAEGLLRACPDLRILATSREPLGIAGETAWRVPSLAVPDPRRVPPVEQLTECEAARLFVERATAASPTFTVTERNAPAVAQVCHCLDGIPLALELAAARVRVLSAEQLAARLGDRFRLLTGGSRTALPRQQTLRATVDWSYDLLAEDERRLLNRLSVFAGGWSLEAAEAVCAGDGVDSDAVLDLLGRLVDKSLVLAEERDGAARYRLLETLRQYGRECLARSGDPEAIQRRHVAFFLALAERAEPDLTGAEQGVWLGWLEQEHENLRAVLQWTIEGGEAELGLRLAGAVWRFWWVRGHLSEGRRWLEGLLAVAGRSGAALAATRAKALSGAGVLAGDQSDYRRAAALLEESLALFRDLGDKRGSAASLSNLGFMATFQGDYRRAGALSEESLTLFRDLGDKGGIAFALLNLGLTALYQGDYRRATGLLEESLALFRDLGDKWGSASSLGNLARLAIWQRDYRRATALLEESLALSRDLGDKGGIAWSLRSLARVARDEGDYRRAAALLEESLALFRDLGDKRGSAWSLNNLGGVARDQGDYRRAVALLEESLALFRDLGDKRGSASSLLNLGLTALYQSEYRRATTLLEESLALSRDLGDKGGIAWSLGNLARVAGDQGDYRRAAALLEESLALFRDLGNKRGSAWSLGNLARVAGDQGDYRRATALLDESLALFRDLGDKGGTALSMEALAAVACAQEQPEPAARLFGAAQAIREAIGAPQPPADQARYDRCVAAARACLGEHAFAAAWAEGRALSLEQAIAAVLTAGG